MLKSRAIACLVVLAALGFGACGSVFAADQQLVIGVVDVAKVFADAPRIKQFNEELIAFRKTLASKLDIRIQNTMLDEKEMQELVDLKLKANATDQDKARIKALEDIDRERDAELKQLQSTATPNEQQKARQNELQEMLKKSKSTGDALAKDYDGQYQNKMAELNEKAEGDIREAVTKIAAEKNMQFVIDKTAMLVGGVDITQDVIGKLDRK